MTTAQQIVDQLNAYAASHSVDGHAEPLNNIWQDLIYGLPEYDPEATAAADPSDRSDILVLTDGTTITWDQPNRTWYVA